MLGVWRPPPHIIAIPAGRDRVASDHRRSRFRVAVHPAHRSTPARAVGVLRSRAVQHAAREAPRQAAGRHHPLRRAEERLGRRRAEVRRRALRPRPAGAGHLLRHAADDRPAGRRGAALGPARVRARARAGGRGGGAAAALRRRAGRVPGLGEPRRRRRPRARRLLVAATSSTAPIVAMEAPERSLYGLLFHPEVVHTEHGKDILRRFAFDVCGCRGDWTIASFIEEATERIRTQVGPCRQGRVRPVRRRGLHGRRDADAPRHRRSPDLHLRRQRAAAVRRGEPDSEAVPREAAAAARLRGCDRHLPDRASTASPTRSRSGRSSAAPSSTCSSSAPTSSAASGSSGRGRSIRT